MNQPDKSPSAFPRRDGNGRVVSALELVGSAMAAVVIGVIVLVAIDGLFTLIGVGTFGKISGWLAGILMVFGYVEDFRAWKGVAGRAFIAVMGVVIGVAVGSIVNGALTGLASVFAGAISVAIAGLIYAVVWFFGIRWSANRFGDPLSVTPRSVRGNK